MLAFHLAMGMGMALPASLLLWRGTVAKKISSPEWGIFLGAGLGILYVCNSCAYLDNWMYLGFYLGGHRGRGSRYTGDWGLAG